MNRFKEMFRALKCRNARLFFPGLAISQIGVWIQNVAISWLIYDITKSSFIMGTIVFLNSLPLLFLTPFGGIIADKFNRHKLLLIIQILYALQALILAFLAFTGLIRIWNIIILAMFLSTIVAIDAPLRQSTYVYVINDKKDLGNVISLNSMCFNIARLAGPAISGMIIAYSNFKFCFLFNFIFILPIIVLIKKMVIDDKKDEKTEKESVFKGLKEGFLYCFKTPQIRTLISYFGAYCFLIMVYPMLIPIYTAETLHSNADVLGFLLGSAGVGSLISSILLAMKTTTKNMKEIIFSCTILACVCFISLGFVHSVYLALILMFGVGFGSSATIISESTLLQTYISNIKRGRVMSLNSIAFFGTVAISNLFAGSIANVAGISNTFIILGLLMITIALILGYKILKLNFNGFLR